MVGRPTPAGRSIGATLNPLDRLTPERRAVVLQVVRFGLTGGLLAALVAGGYWLLATFTGISPMTSLTLNYIAATGLGYVLHSRFSFRGHGTRDRAMVRTLRFVVVNATGYASNQFFVWLLVERLGGPTWWPVLPILFVTPLLTFALNRRWVFA